MGYVALLGRSATYAERRSKVNKKASLMAAWVAILLLSLVSPAQAQAAISGVNPQEGTVGTEVTLSGSGFGWKQGEVLLGAEKCRVLAWSDTEITCQVHKPQPPGEYPITLLLQGDKKPAEPLTFSYFAMRRPRIIHGQNSELVRDGDTVTVEGAFFGDKKGEVTLAYLEDGAGVVERAQVVDWSMAAIRFELPGGLTGRFALIVRNEVGAGYALLDLGGGAPPLLSGYGVPPYPGFGNEPAYNNSSGIYYKGIFYVFSIDPSCDLLTGCEYIRVRRFDPSSGWLSARDGSFPLTHTYGLVRPLVVEDKLFVFINQAAGWNTWGRLSYTTCTYNVSTGTCVWDSSWHQILDLTSPRDDTPAPVYDPANHRIIVYYSKHYLSRGYVRWTYSDDNGVTWHDMGDLADFHPVGLNHSPGAVYAPGVTSDGKPYNVLLATRDSHADDQGMVYALRDGSAVGTSLAFGEFSGLPFLVDLGSDHIALIYAAWAEGVPTIRKMDKRTGQWGEPYQPFPQIVEYQYCWHSTPIGAISLKPNSSGEYDRIFYIFWGYTFYAWYMDRSDSRWMMTGIENLGPE
jgi:hypothetical protein